MSFAAKLTRMPRAFDPERAKDVAVPGLDGDLLRLVQHSAACSPYLADLIRREADWLPQAFDVDVASVWALEADDPALPALLRQAKRRIALLTALADLGGVWSLEQVTGTLTRFADAACDLALKAALKPLIARGKLPGLTEDNVQDAGGLSVFAMGKMGAFELNYSSDIDLICLFDETRFEADDYSEVRSGFVRAIRKMCSTLSDIGAEGYVFRTDLRLRPDPAVTPVALSYGAAERYYESLGRTWERAAWIKARPAAGDIKGGARFQNRIRPFVWRKHLDFAAIQDAHDMRLAIRDAKGLGGPITLPGHDMKLGRGGIREIEFFTQTRQLISGGRAQGLRVRGTVEGLERLMKAGWVGRDVAKDLTAHYRFHRTVEHCLQMVRDAQTHSLPTQETEFARLAAMMDREVEPLKSELLERLTDVHTQTEGFFAPKTDEVSEPERMSKDMTDRWLNYPALRNARAQHLFERLEPVLAKGFAEAARPDEAKAAFDRFLSGLPAGVQLFSLFEANPTLVDLLLDILTTSPALADHLSRNAQVLDAVIGGDFFTPWPGEDGLLQLLGTDLDNLDDYERKLDAVRRWKKEWHFRIGVHVLRGLIDAKTAGRQYADLASAVLKGLWPHVVDQFAAKHGPPPGRGAVLVGMGSLGAGRQSPGSDLDMIMIYDPGAETESSGRKPLATRMYFARLTQAMITAVSTQTAEGRLYEVDMRLRPSGNQGPVATSWAAFQSYQREEAWLWEHLALTRARVLTGQSDFAADVQTFIEEVLALPRQRADVLGAVGEMRARIAAAKSDGTLWQTKVGGGGAQDIEIFAQAGALLRGVRAYDIAQACLSLTDADLADHDGAVQLAKIYETQMSVQMAARLVGVSDVDLAELGRGALGVLLRALEASDVADAEAQLTQTYETARTIITQGLGDQETTDEQ